jgi:hypothetical protein
MRNRGYHGSSMLVAGLLLTACACAYGMGTAPDPKQPLDPDGAVQLNVTNHASGPMEVYAFGSGTSYRIGTVYPGLSGHFVLRPTMIVNGPVEFLARTSSRDPVFRSGQLLLVPGNVVDFELATTPVTSVARVRP